MLNIPSHTLRYPSRKLITAKLHLALSERDLDTIDCYILEFTDSVKFAQMNFPKWVKKTPSYINKAIREIVESPDGEVYMNARKVQIHDFLHPELRDSEIETEKPKKLESLSDLLNTERTAVLEAARSAITNEASDNHNDILKQMLKLLEKEGDKNEGVLAPFRYLAQSSDGCLYRAFMEAERDGVKDVMCLCDYEANDKHYICKYKKHSLENGGEVHDIKKQLHVTQINK